MDDKSDYVKFNWDDCYWLSYNHPLQRLQVIH